MARPQRRLGNLQAEATSFVGRRRELAEVRKKLTEGRIVCLVGPGGVGKTRLALRVATELGRGFPGGAWLAELGELRDGALVPKAVMAALDLRDQGAIEPLTVLRSYLRDRQLLLVLDNCEHLLEASARLVADLVGAAPGLRVVATSREPLSVTGEHVVPIPPLGLPSPVAAGIDRLRQNEAVQLFVDRAAAASGTFELMASNAAAVADICRRLDGLPLAIELAAVRTRVLTPQQILERLSDRFGLLTATIRPALPRHETLRTTIDWSYDLLTDEERLLLRRLAVFTGRFTLEDTESVCNSPGLALGVLEPLSSLVDKSLVQKQDVDAVACYRLHETTQEYALTRLRESGEAEAIEERSVEHYRSRCLRSAAEAQQGLPGWLEWMDLEVDNIRSVLRRCVARSDPRGKEIAVALSWYWSTRALAEGVSWLDELLAMSPDPVADGWLNFTRGFLAVLQADTNAAMSVLDRAAAAAKASGQSSLSVLSRGAATLAADMAGDAAMARRLLDEAEAAAKTVDTPPVTLGLLHARAVNGLFNGDLETARSASLEGERLSRQVGYTYVLELMLTNLALVELIAGEPDRARPRAIEALGIAREIDDRVGQFYLLDALASVAASSHQPQLAARLMGASETIRAGCGAAVTAVLEPLVREAQESALATLGQLRFKAEFEAGKAMERDSALRLALGESLRDVATVATDPDARLLGKRETEVAQLIAEGLSNKQIGARLFISERTVEGHVRGILNKLGFNSRAQIAGWVESRRGQ